MAEKRNQYAFDKKKYDHVHLQLKKGQREEYQTHAAVMSESLNGFINRAMQETKERDEAPAYSLGRSFAIKNFLI